MKKLYYIFIIILFASCSIEDENGEQGTSDGSATSPVELTVGTAKLGSVAYNDDSFYKFTTSSTGAGNYKLVVDSLTVTDSWSSSRSVTAYIYSNSSYAHKYELEFDSCLASCTMVFDYEVNLHANTTYYLKIYGYGNADYTLTVTKGGSQGSKNNPIELELGTALTSGTVEGYYGSGQSYYKFRTSGADNYTLTLNNSASLDCSLYSDSGFSEYVSSSYNNCTAGTNLSKTFKGESGTGLATITTYYLKIEPQASNITEASTTTYNIIVAAEGN